MPERAPGAWTPGAVETGPRHESERAPAALNPSVAATGTAPRG